MNGFQVVIVVWLGVLTLLLLFLTICFGRHLVRSDKIEDDVKTLKQDRAGNPFAEAGIKALQELKGSQDG